jgi:hypothetical protein
LLSDVSIPNVRILGNREPFGIEFTLDVYKDDLDVDKAYTKIPTVPKYHRQHMSKTGRCIISLELSRKRYATIMNYNDSLLSQTIMRNKKQGMIYKCYNPKPYQGGGFSPK